MRLVIDATQGQPSFTVCDGSGVIKAKVYACKDGVVVSTANHNYRLPVGCRTIEEQVGQAVDVPKEDGFEI